MERQLQQKLTLIHNMLRYSEMEAKEGSYLSAILVLDRVAKDIGKGVQDGSIDIESGQNVLQIVQQMKNRYLKESKIAAPKTFVYDRMEFSV